VNLAIGIALMAQTRLVFGIVGHPGMQQPPQAKALWDDPALQLTTLQERGLGSYRFNVILGDDSVGAAAYLEQLVDLADARHITLHPILVVTDHGYDRVYPFVRRFAHRIRDWELENEVDHRPAFKTATGPAAGLSPGDYDTPLAHQWAAVMRDMARAIADVRTQTGEPLRTVVDFMGFDFGFIPFLEREGVAIDVVAYHYYFGFGVDPYHVRVIPGTTIDLFGRLGEFRRPVIINEMNAGEIHAPKQGKPYDDERALASLKKHIDYIAGQRVARIEGIEFYELYDEPWKDAVESNFGFMKAPGQIKIQMLVAAVYACGRISRVERETLIGHHLFTEPELVRRRAACRDSSADSPG
jgi:hypothetical protein